MDGSEGGGLAARDGDSGEGASEPAPGGEGPLISAGGPQRSGRQPPEAETQRGVATPGTQADLPHDTPDDVGDGSDDDIVARQLREAAESETDPELREKLWDEYRAYKNRNQ